LKNKWSVTSGQRSKAILLATDHWSLGTDDVNHSTAYSNSRPTLPRLDAAP
jgi:hypothetical protein